MGPSSRLRWKTINGSKAAEYYLQLERRIYYLKFRALSIVGDTVFSIVRDKKLALLDNGPTLLTICSFLLKLTNSLTILTNGAACSLSEETKQMLLNHPTAKVMIVEDEIQAIDHKDRQIHHITFKAGGKTPLELDALYAPCPTVQHCTNTMELGCELVEPHQRLKIDQNFQTTVPGVYAAGDCESMIRQVSLAVASGAQAGGLIAMSLAAEDMNQNNI